MGMVLIIWDRLFGTFQPEIEEDPVKYGLTKQLEKAVAANDETAAKTIAQEIENRKLEYAGKKLVNTMAHPSYFNSGCCCFSDGDVTGIEVADGFIRLIKWESSDEGPLRKVLEESPLYYIFDSLV